MTPAELAKSGSEHGEQRALFAWCRMAEAYGFKAAWDDKCYGHGGAEYIAANYLYDGPCQDFDMQQKARETVSELAWYHAIPNGGLRDKRTASMLKAEGVKRGIPDTFLPVPMWAMVGAMKCITYAGLYVEMKREKSEGRAKGRTSSEQDDAIAWLRHSGYAVAVCFTWDQAAAQVQSYIEAVRKGSANV